MTMAKGLVRGRRVDGDGTRWQKVGSKYSQNTSPIYIVVKLFAKKQHQDDILKGLQKTHAKARLVYENIFSSEIKE